MSKHLHVFGHSRWFRYQVTILNKVCVSGESWGTAEEAAVHCDIFKTYLDAAYKLSLPRSFDREQFCTEALSLNVPLSSPLNILSMLPEKVRAFLSEHHAALMARMSSLPNRTTWDVYRYDENTRGRADCQRWVTACEWAEIDANAFAGVNQQDFEGLVRGAIKSLEGSLNALAQAEKRVNGKDNPKLDARASALSLARAELSEKLPGLRALFDAFRSETIDVESKLALLESKRPKLYPVTS